MAISLERIFRLIRVKARVIRRPRMLHVHKTVVD